MPDHHETTASGNITHVFGHRFVIETKTGAVLADITPKGLDHITLRVGDRVSLTGEMKPSELKVSRFTSEGRSVEIEHKKKHHDHHHEADPALAMQAATAAGFATVGQPRRKPKHFEVLGRRNQQFTELHIELDGHIRKSKPVDRHDLKWAHELGA